jgi:hypothetical protein
MVDRNRELTNRTRGDEAHADAAVGTLFVLGLSLGRQNQCASDHQNQCCESVPHNDLQSECTSL